MLFRISVLDFTLGVSMTDERLAEQQMTEGFLGTSPAKLEKLSDAELASWQSRIPAGLPQYILAEKEWQRRLAIRQLREEFKLEERIANGNRWWAVAAALIGVAGTLAGVGLGKVLEPPAQGTKAVQPVESPPTTQQQAPSTASTSAASSSTSQPMKKAK